MTTHQTPAPMTEGEAGFGAGQTPASPTVPLGEAGPHSSDADAVGAPASEGPREQIPTVPGKVDGIIGVQPARLQCRECGAVWTNEEMVGGRDCWPLIFIESGYGFHRHDPHPPRRLCRECLAAARDAHGCSEGTR